MPSNNNNLINIPKRKSDIGLGPLLDSGRDNNSLNKFSKEIEEINFKIKEKKNDLDDMNKKIENSKDEYVKLSEKVRESYLIYYLYIHI